MMMLIAETAMTMATLAGVMAKTLAANNNDNHHHGGGSGRGGEDDADCGRSGLTAPFVLKRTSCRVGGGMRMMPAAGGWVRQHRLTSRGPTAACLCCHRRWGRDGR